MAQKEKGTGPKCQICKRNLTSPESIALGIGPVCYARLFNGEKPKRKKQSPFADISLDIQEFPLDEFVILTRENGIPKTNVPHLILKHSNTGFDWSYNGSGPSDLALNICEYFLRVLAKDGYAIGKKHRLHNPARGEIHSINYMIYENFRDEYIATMPHDGGKIPSNLILHTLKQSLQRQKTLF